MDDIDPRPELGDALGAAMLAALAGDPGMHVVERSDGFVDAMAASAYFAEPEEWPAVDTAALELVGGRVLDVGAGAGRHSLALQQRGSRPVALDVSPGAVDTCRRQGVEQTFVGTVPEYAEHDPDLFDAALMMGHNLALLGSASHAQILLEALRRLLRPGGLVVGTCLDPYGTDDPANLAYHARNEAMGRYPGQLRLRVRHRNVACAWFDYLFASPAELGELAARTGWSVEDTTEPDPTYLAILRPT